MESKTTTTNKLLEKEITFVVGGRNGGRWSKGRGRNGQMGESGQKKQTSSYKVSTWDRICNIMTIANIAVWCIWMLLMRVNPKSSNHKEKFISFYFLKHCICMR